MDAKASLAKFVDHYIDQVGGIEMMAIGTTIDGLAKIFSAYGHARAKRGNWSTMLDNLRSGRAEVTMALPSLREVGPGVEKLVEIAERELGFATELEAEIVRVSAGESTLV